MLEHIPDSVHRRWCDLHARSDSVLTWMGNLPLTTSGERSEPLTESQGCLDAFAPIGQSSLPTSELVCSAPAAHLLGYFSRLVSPDLSKRAFGVGHTECCTHNSIDAIPRSLTISRARKAKPLHPGSIRRPRPGPWRQCIDPSNCGVSVAVG